MTSKFIEIQDGWNTSLILVDVNRIEYLQASGSGTMMRMRSGADVYSTTPYVDVRAMINGVSEDRFPSVRDLK